MKFHPDRCPECGGEPIGTVEELRGLALLMPDDQGGFEYAGETEVWWDDQRTVIDDQGHVPLECEERHQWEALKL